MSNQTHCPTCKSENIYFDGNLWTCPECNFEWSESDLTKESQTTFDESLIRDAHGNILSDGDTVVVIKELKIKGSSSAVKVGTKVKSIRLTDGEDGHNIACKIDGIGAINLKSEFVKKQ
jgi:protein PhnA